MPAIGRYQKCLKQLSKAVYVGEARCHEAVWPLSTWCGGAAVPRRIAAVVPPTAGAPPQGLPVPPSQVLPQSAACGRRSTCCTTVEPPLPARRAAARVGKPCRVCGWPPCRCYPAVGAPAVRPCPLPQPQAGQCPTVCQPDSPCVSQPEAIALWQVSQSGS